jgi:hypothetical protein
MIIHRAWMDVIGPTRRCGSVSARCLGHYGRNGGGLAQRQVNIQQLHGVGRTFLLRI